MTARIYRPAKTAMQSGAARRDRWLLEYEPEQPSAIEPLMGWTSSSDMRQQIKLWFDSKEEALDYARRNGIAAQVDEPKDPRPRQMSYADNFKSSRLAPWTH